MSQLLYEGKAKQVWSTDDPGQVIIRFTDQATAFDGKKRGEIGDKGVVNSRVTGLLFPFLERRGVSTHFIRSLDERSILARHLEIIRLEVVVRNVVAGSLSKRLGIEEGVELDLPVVELYYKNDDLGDPLLNDDHVRVLGLASRAEREMLVAQARRINDLLRPLLAGEGLVLVDFKLEFGRQGEQIYLGDEISPDTCRFWDAATGERLDKDRFRRDLGNVEDAYQEVLRRVERAVARAEQGS